MSANWQPPPFGLPFPMPPFPQQLQQAQQNAVPPHDGQSGLSDQYRAPPPDAFANPWSFPGLNHQAYGQNAQQPQYPHAAAAWPPPAPTPEMWNQMHMYSMMQNGAMPPIPGMNFPSTPLPHTPHPPFHHMAPSASFPPPAAQPVQPVQPASLPAPLSTPAAAFRRSEVTEGDKEDGELSEGDQSAPLLAGHDRRGAEPPRSVPQNKPAWLQKPSSAHSNAAARTMPTPSGQQGHKPAAEPATANGIARQREDAKQFIRILHQNNIGYRNLADEGLDASPLRGLYQSLNLPSEPEPVPPPKPNSIAPTQAPVVEATLGGPSLSSTNGAKPAPSVKTNVTIPPAKSAPSPVDRQAYIARLQAAKLAKQGAKVTPPQNTPPATAAAVKKPPPTTTAAKSDPKEIARQAEAIRERVQALTKTAPSASVPPTPPATQHLPTVTPSSLLPTSPSSVNTPANVPSSSFSGIPGLFMNAQSVGAPVNTAQSANGSSSRKRPHESNSANAVTAPNPSLCENKDLQNDLSAVPTTGTVSDGEYEGSEMDLSDDHLAKPSAATPPVSVQDTQRPLRAPQSLPNLPSPSTSALPGMSTASTPGPQTPGSQARSEEMDSTGMAMAKLKAEIQRKQREKRQRELLAAKASPSLAGTAQGSTNQPNGDMVQAPVGSATQTPRANVPSDQNLARESKRRRRAEIESGIPSLDAEIANNAVRMAELTKQMEELAANNEKMKQDKERLVQELESLGIDTEGMPHAELQAKKDEIEREREVMAKDVTAESPSPVTSRNALEGKAKDTIAPVVNTAHQFGIPGLGGAIAPYSANVPPPAAVHTVPTSEIAPATANVAAPLQSRHDLASSELAQGNGTEPTRHQQTATSGDDEEDDFYSPAPPDDFSTDAQAVKPVTPHPDAPSPSEEGEVAMSESEDEYEPDEVQSLPAAPDTRTRDAVVESSSASSLTSSDDEEGYEPPEIDQPMLDNHSPDAQQGEADDGAMDISSSDDDSNGSESTSSSADDISPVPVATKGGAEYITITDGMGPEQGVQSATSAPEETTVIVEEEPDPTRFVPYESPLRQFKSYRYHPNYAQDVPNGFLSMTFSHQIDPDQPLCPTESVGETCADPQCLFQHFQGMNISGEKLLVQLGTANPGKTPDERQRWTDGLRDLLKNLRQRSAKDPTDIAMEIAKYRRQFFNDDSRVINL